MSKQSKDTTGYVIANKMQKHDFEHNKRFNTNIELIYELLKSKNNYLKREYNKVSFSQDLILKVMDYLSKLSYIQS